MRNLIFLVFCLLIYTTTSASEKTIKVGAKGFTEQYILSSLLTLYFQENGFIVEHKLDLLSKVIRKALIDRDIDIFWEYTGTSYSLIHNGSDLSISTNSNLLYETVKKLDYTKDRIIWLKKSSINNPYALVMLRTKSNELGIKKISQLNGNISKLKFGSSRTFRTRNDGTKAIEKKYGFRLPIERIEILSMGAMYRNLKKGKIDFAVRYGTDSQLAEKGEFISLKDDKNAFPYYNPTPILLEETAKKYPEIVKLANDISTKLTQKEMIEMNFKVDTLKEDFVIVAKIWLISKGLIK